MLRPYDIAIVGGGFSGLAVLANLVRDTAQPLTIAVISRDPRGVFGPAYATPRPEHLLNVPAGNMGLFADNTAHFYEWLQASGAATAPGDFMSRKLYGEYLAAVLAETSTMAREKIIRIDWFQGEVDDVEDHAEYLAIKSGGDEIPARRVVLAIGNSLATEKTSGPVTEQPWQFDFSKLTPEMKRVALIGSGLTGADIIISILDSCWQGEIYCYSGHGALPKNHLVPYDAQKRTAPDASAYLSQRLSKILQAIREDMRETGRDWRYVVDSLRPITQDLWRSLTATDKERLVRKYFTLWNVHRHRYAPHIGARIDAAVTEGRLKLVKARVTGTMKKDGGIVLGLKTRAGDEESPAFDRVFRCTGVDYKVASNPLLSKLVDKGMLKLAGNGYGIRASDNLLAYRDFPCEIYALGAPLFGQLFETTAVPELRQQAKIISNAVLADSTARKSRASG